jgi:deoxyribodipyrimidine photo-lyase
MAPVVVWFRRDLRLSDHGGLARAAELAGSDGVVGLFVHDERAAAGSGPNRRRFLAACLEELETATGGTLVQVTGRPAEVVPAVAERAGAEVVVVSGEVGPYGRRRDQQVAAALRAAGRRLVAADWPYAAVPGSVLTGAGAPFAVFTPYFRAWQGVAARRPVVGPAVRWRAVDVDGIGTARPAPTPTPPVDWWSGLPLGPAASLPPAGEQAAAQRLAAFVADGLDHYAERRDLVGVAGTSQLSPALHFGCLHPRSVLAAVDAHGPAERFVAELAWREFAADVLWHRPSFAWEPLVAAARWLAVDDGPDARAAFTAWATGETGVPLVDAAMRQLLAEGWVHNRARMVAASFLVKDLHLDWRWGARWFLWHLVDGDLASNNHGWQWVAGTGTDAAPFHRIFNPWLQQARFDPDGAYVARYLPAGRRPAPIVDHDHARREALARWEVARRTAAARSDGGSTGRRR